MTGVWEHCSTPARREARAFRTILSAAYCRRAEASFPGSGSFPTVRGQEEAQGQPVADSFLVVASNEEFPPDRRIVSGGGADYPGRSAQLPPAGYREKMLPAC